jgi:hypothetical protein
VVRTSENDIAHSLKKNYFCVFNSINTIVTDIEDNIRIYRLPSGRGMDHEIDISLASGSGNIIFTGPYHDPWASISILSLCMFRIDENVNL